MKEIKEGMECMSYNNPLEGMEEVVAAAVEKSFTQTMTVTICKLSGTRLLNVRDAPRGNILGILDEDDIFGSIPQPEPSTEWIMIRSKKGLSGWVMSRYITPSYTEEWPIS